MIQKAKQPQDQWVRKILQTGSYGRMLSDVLSDFKLLGVVISSDLTWDSHVSYILSKSSKRIYCILNLCKAGVPTRDIVYIYCSVIRSVLEYECPCMASWFD